MPKKKPKGASEAKKKRMEAKRLAKMARKAEKKAAQGGAVRPESLQGLVGISQPLQKKQYPTGDTMPMPPPPLLELIHDFLKDYKYIKAAHGVRTDNQKRPGHNMSVWKHSSKGYPNLLKIFRTWFAQNPLQIPETKGKDIDAAEENSSTTSSSSDDDVMSDVAVSKPSAIVTATNPPLASLKRKASASSSDSDSQSSSTSSESDGSSDSESEVKEEVDSTPAAKKAKVKHTTPTTLPATSGSTSSSSSSSSDEESDSGLPTPAAKLMPASKTSSSDSSSGSSSEEESEEEEPVAESKQSTTATRTGSDSSATITGADGDLGKAAGRATSPSSETSSSDSSSDEENTAPLKPKSESKKQEMIVYTEPLSKKKRKRDPSAVGEQKIVPATANTFKKLKKAHISFSRIPDDIKVDERFASNKYVPYDYAEKAHNDLIVTKGKGFTKAKNKGKQGSYKGGMIDTNAGRGIKFED